MDLLIEDCQILTEGPEGIEFVYGSIAVEGDRIAAVGNVPSDFRPENIIEAEGMIAVPGLINAHTHLPMGLLRNYADDMALMDWLKNKIFPAEDKMTADDVYWGALLGIGEMIRSGVTACADMYFYMDKVGEAVEAAGIRANLGFGMGAGSREEARGKIEDGFRPLFEEWHGAAEDRIRVELAPHAVYTVSRDAMEEIAAAAGRFGTGVHIHFSESKDEVAECRRTHGMSPVALGKETGLFGVPRLLAAHCVHLDEGDFDLLADERVSVVHNPSSNMKLANGIAPVGKMLERGIRVAIGTDGAASNNNLNMLEEIHLASLLQKGGSGNPQALPAPQVFSMATGIGAEALGLAETGSIAAGRKADIALIDGRSLHMQPQGELISSLVYSAQASDVDTVICDGNVLMEGRELLTIDEEEVAAKAAESARRILR
jgi:5-methylthioadenosine/S-adenosylhomocysteine deaminase